MPARVDLYADEFSTLIQQKGMRAVWEKATVCPCQSGETGQPDFNCTLCYGQGFLYFGAENIKIVTTSFSGKPENEIIGFREPGTAYGTPPANVVMGYKDRVFFPDFQCRFSQLVKFDRATNRSTRLQKPVANVTFLSDGTQVFKYGDDFILSEVDRRYLIWNTSRMPAPEQSLTCLYMTHPSYLVDDILHELRATFVALRQPTDKFFELPKQYLLKREDFIYNPNPANVDAAYDVVETEEVDLSEVDGSNSVCAVCPISGSCIIAPVNGGSGTKSQNVGGCDKFRYHKKHGRHEHQNTPSESTHGHNRDHGGGKP